MKSKLVKIQAAALLGCVLVMGTGCGAKADQPTGEASNQEIEIAEEAVPKSAVPQTTYVKVPFIQMIRRPLTHLTATRAMYQLSIPAGQMCASKRR